VICAYRDCSLPARTRTAQCGDWRLFYCSDEHARGTPLQTKPDPVARARAAKPKFRRPRGPSRRIELLSERGEVLQEFAGLAAAAAVLGVTAAAVYAACTLRRRCQRKILRFKGSVGWELPAPTRIGRPPQPIRELDDAGRLVREWESASAAGAHYGVGRTAISWSLSKGVRAAGRNGKGRIFRRAG
jgi:hypothetical protein